MRRSTIYQKMSDKPLVSTIIPAYNAEKYLAEAIESVLAQTYQPIELIVVDNGSTDGTHEIVQGFGVGIRYIYLVKAGLSAALNRGIIMAQGDYVAFLDADDLWSEEKTEWQMAVLQDDPGLGMVFGYIQQFISPELPEEVKKCIHCPPEPMPGYCRSTMLARKKAIDVVGPFLHFRAGEFLDWYARAKDKGVRRTLIPQVVARRRLHTANTEARDPGSRGDFARVLKAVLDRRRSVSRGNQHAE
jgi:glycosyltransferase involved in cell wall biosynthesis